jgi:Ni,Fe-hydrogenase I cytochrome b subunit
MNIDEVRERRQNQINQTTKYFGLIMSVFYILAGLGIYFFQFPFKVSPPLDMIFCILFIIYGIFRAYRLFAKS